VPFLTGYATVLFCITTRAVLGILNSEGEAQAEVASKGSNIMAKNKGNDGWWIAGLVVGGLALLYYLQTGLDNENSALIPDTIEGKIDSLVKRLNNTFGKQWIDLGVWYLKSQLENALPPNLVGLIDVVAQVENMSKHRPMRGDEKRQLAVQILRAA
jgi:hypothetical protein